MNTEIKALAPAYKFVSRVYTKPNVQAMLKALRTSGATVEKLDAGYVAKDPNGHEIFKAMNGSRGYLVRHVENLFSLKVVA